MATDEKTPILDDYLTEPELATELGVCERTVKRWRDLGEGPPFTRIGRSIRYRRPTIGAWLASREIDPNRDPRGERP